MSIAHKTRNNFHENNINIIHENNVIIVNIIFIKQHEKCTNNLNI